MATGPDEEGQQPFKPRAVDYAVRAQIEAAKAHLAAEGLTEILEPPSPKTFEGLHTIRAMFAGEIRLLRLSYQWLSDDNPPAKVVAWLKDKEVARGLMRNEREVEVRDSGEIRRIPL